MNTRTTEAEGQGRSCTARMAATDASEPSMANRIFMANLADLWSHCARVDMFGVPRWAPLRNGPGAGPGRARSRFQGLGRWCYASRHVQNQARKPRDRAVMIRLGTPHTETQTKLLLLG